MTPTAELVRQASEFTTYDDVFALALANSRLVRLSPDSNRWTAAFYEVWKELGDQIPELRKLAFDERPPLPPQCEEASQLIMTLAMSRYLSLPNPTFPHIAMTRAQKSRVKRERANLLEQYQHQMPAVVRILEKHLAL